jgi:uncharacterized membrane protein (UPF0127 family)
MKKIYQIFVALFIIYVFGFFGCLITKNYATDYQAYVINKDLIISSKLGDVRFSVEVFDTEQKRALGLMNRASLDEDHGGFFVFDKLENHIFWMKNTLVPLDIIFFDDDLKIVGIIENTTPLSLRGLNINKKSRYALEVLAGTVKKYAIDQNTTASFFSELL